MTKSKYFIPGILAVVFALVALWVEIKMPHLVDGAFIISALAAGFFIGKNNQKGAVDAVTK